MDGRLPWQREAGRCEGDKDGPWPPRDQSLLAPELAREKSLFRVASYRRGSTSKMVQAGCGRGRGLRGPGGRLGGVLPIAYYQKLLAVLKDCLCIYHDLCKEWGALSWLSCMLDGSKVGRQGTGNQ